MIRAFIFDLDGTLVQTESLKALSYARAVVELSPDTLTEEEVIREFEHVVGLPRREVSRWLLKRFQLETVSSLKKEAFSVPTAWQAFVQIRLKYYNQILSDPQILPKHLCPHNKGLLTWARKNGYLTALATMSHCKQAKRVMEILNLQNSFHFVATRDDVEQGKPHPEIYLLAADELSVSPNECLVIEDSPTGIRAALAAKMKCMAVTNSFTRRQVHQSGLLNQEMIVDQVDQLQEKVDMFLLKMANN